ARSTRYASRGPSRTRWPTSSSAIPPGSSACGPRSSAIARCWRRTRSGTRRAAPPAGGARAGPRLRRSWEPSLGLPLFAYGLLVNGLPYLLPRWLAHPHARKETDYPPPRLPASVLGFPIFWALEIWIVWRLTSLGWAFLFALSLPISGLLAYRYLRGVGRLRSQLRFGC